MIAIKECVTGVACEEDWKADHRVFNLSQKMKDSQIPSEEFDSIFRKLGPDIALKLEFSNPGK